MVYGLLSTGALAAANWCTVAVWIASIAALAQLFFLTLGNLVHLQLSLSSRITLKQVTAVLPHQSKPGVLAAVSK
jgi:hypothetical protein